METTLANPKKSLDPSSPLEFMNWCHVLESQPAGYDVEHVPTAPRELFEWMCAQDWPLLEDEVPPTSYYELQEVANMAFECERCERKLFSVGDQRLQRTIGTQTAADQVEVDTQTMCSDVQLQELPTHNLPTSTSIDVQTQTDQKVVEQPSRGGEGQAIELDEQMDVEQPDVQTVEQAKDPPQEQRNQFHENSLELRRDQSQAGALGLDEEQTKAEAARETPQTPEMAALPLPLPLPTSQAATRPLFATVQDLFSLRRRERSIWSLLKTLLLLISLLHGCFILGSYLYRMPLLRRLILRAQAICAPQPPQPPPPRSLPAFIWNQLCRLAHKLHII